MPCLILEDGGRLDHNTARLQLEHDSAMQLVKYTKHQLKYNFPVVIEQYHVSELHRTRILCNSHFKVVLAHAI